MATIGTAHSKSDPRHEFTPTEVLDLVTRQIALLELEIGSLRREVQALKDRDLPW